MISENVSAGSGLVAGSLATQPGRFAQNSTWAATDAGAQFVYETDAGALWWDADGTGAGAGVIVATFTGAPGLTANDIVLV